MSKREPKRWEVMDSRHMNGPNGTSPWAARAAVERLSSAPREPLLHYDGKGQCAVAAEEAAEDRTSEVGEVTCSKCKLFMQDAGIEGIVFPPP